MLDLRNVPIKTIVQAFSVTPSQAKNLSKGNTEKFTSYELQTFLPRLSPEIK
ncbi:hypothetical protein C427_2329 [Paraglaciecola psychrophila 170]|uniref:Uncharacterized protein n=2 Tax=Paraglaciecola TaxID=1621534 RepID=K6YZ08_9ALTE|nr:hypothetical protein C427_2329 [Paraglaciecola psychrophila 170]GAC37989.1 hypothetical protein GPSY_2368 [Paraglaciecola psychrophila 170]